MGKSQELEQEQARELEREQEQELERELEREQEQEQARELEREREQEQARELERERELELERELERERELELEREQEREFVTSITNAEMFGRLPTVTYILDGKKPVKEPDLLRWSKWFEVIKNRVVAQDKIQDIHVSTVFLGLDHNWLKSDDPILFETMIFGGPHNNYQERYRTWKEAEVGHKNAIKLVKESMQ